VGGQAVARIVGELWKRLNSAATIITQTAMLSERQSDVTITENAGISCKYAVQQHYVCPSSNLDFPQRVTKVREVVILGLIALNR
jgi:hypothetical protein